MTTFQPSYGGLQGVAFLDTNVLVRLFHFWEACRGAAIRLDAVARGPDLDAALEAVGVSAEALKRNGDPVRLGIAPFQLLSRGADSYRYLSSHVAWAELHHVLLVERSMERMILKGVPRSMRVKRPQMLFRAVLEEADYGELQGELRAFRGELREDYGLDVITVEDQSAGFVADPRDVWHGAQAVWSHILIEVLDAYLYAAAAAAGADVFITADGSLRDALNRLNHTEEDSEELASSLKQALSEACGLDNESVELPRPIRPQGPLPGV